MKRLALSLFAVLAVPLSALPQKPTVRRLSDPHVASRILAQVRAAQTTRAAGPHAQATIESRTSRTIVFPAAGSVHGAGGEFFRSDVTIECHSPSVLAIWIGRNSTNPDPPAWEIDGVADFGYPITYRDFVGTTLGLEGQLGAIWLVPLNAEGDLDENGVIDGFSRIWTNQPGRSGTVSQQFQAVDPFSFIFYLDTTVMGLQHNAQYRSSWGIVNLDDVEHHYRVMPTSLQHPAQADLQVTVPAWSMKQEAVSRNDNFGEDGMEIIVALLDDFEIFPPTWVSYGTSTDNETGDGWVVLGSANWDDEDFDGFFQ